MKLKIWLSRILQGPSRLPLPDLLQGRSNLASIIFVRFWNPGYTNLPQIPADQVLVPSSKDGELYTCSVLS